MRMPFERLMEQVANLDPENSELTLGELSARWGEPAERIMDALDAVKVLYLLGDAEAFLAPGREKTYITIHMSGGNDAPLSG